MNKFYDWLMTGFYAGRFPAPGTVGSVMAFAVWVVWFQGWSTWAQWLLILVAFAFGVYATQVVAVWREESDPKSVVWDEFVGVWVVCALLAMMGHTGLLELAVGLVVFRFFDIVKPFPIGWVDSNLAGGWGIMLDDVVAALATVLVMQLGLYLFGVI